VGDAGEFKTRDSDIIERYAFGWFAFADPWQYGNGETGRVDRGWSSLRIMGPSLIAVAAFSSFLCVHHSG
jgi:hypothetical protein